MRRLALNSGEGPICLPDAQGIPVSWFFFQDGKVGGNTFFFCLVKKNLLVVPI